MAVAGKHGISQDTPKNIMFGAGTIHKNLVYSSETNKWNYNETIIGATSGGSKLTITPEITNIEIDGALVKVKGLSDIKTGETATMEINFTELSADLIKTAVIGTNGSSLDDNFDLVESKASIEEGDYFTNIAFVGHTLDGAKIMVILDNALCTNGLELEGKNKEAGVATLTFECYAPLTSDLDKLPYHIYYPTKTA